MAASSPSNRRQGVEMMKKPGRMSVAAPKRKPRKLTHRASSMMKKGRNAGGVRAKS